MKKRKFIDAHTCDVKSRRRSGRAVLASAVALAALWATGTPPAPAAEVINDDAKTYNYEVWYDDLSEPQKGVLEPRKKLLVDNKRATVVMGKFDSILLHGNETVHVRGGVMRVRETQPAKADKPVRSDQARKPDVPQRTESAPSAPHEED